MDAKNTRNDQMKTDLAWASLQEKLKNEPVNLQWEQWSAQQVDDGNRKVWGELQMEDRRKEMSGTELKDGDGYRHLPSQASRHKRKKYIKWASGAAAAAVAAVMITTPIGNQALASILGQFQMDTITTVQENDMEKLFNSFFPDGKARTANNQYGTFERKTGNLEGGFDINTVSDKLHRQIVIPNDFKESGVSVNPSESLTFKMNVNEINDTMKKLGASSLLPSSVDGKPITLELSESVHMTLNTAGGKYVNFMQQPVPRIVVDPSVNMQEAMKAILNFPLLPSNLKQGLENAGALNGGSVPLPLVMQGDETLEKIAGLEVLVDKNEYDQNNAHYSAVWVKDGQLFELSGVFEKKSDLTDKITELVQS